MSDIVVASGWRSRLEELVGSKRQTLMVAAALAAAAVAGWFAVGTRAPAQIAPPATITAAVPSATPTATPTMFVHVSGAVRSPGLFELIAGSRVADAIELAGGATETAALDSLNLAEPLADGMKVHVPVEGEPVPVAGSAPTPSAAPVIDINLADVSMLETIPGIGPTRAAAIVAYREQAGGFESVDQLLDVQGIGPSTLEALRSYVTV